jgi:hypothetical protein
MKRHPIDPLSFVLGAFFLVTGLVFAFGGDASKLHVAWFWPVVLGVTGVGLMLLTVRSVRPERQAVPAGEPVPLGDDQDEPGPVDPDTYGFETSGRDEPGADEPDR